MEITNLTQSLKKYALEITLILLYLATTVASSMIFLRPSNSQPPSFNTKQQSFKSDKQNSSVRKIIIDLSGSVLKPDSYELPFPSRLKDALNLAGGLSESADKNFFYRNYNLARVLTDQEKIYIPSLSEISEGVFKESNRLVDYTQSSTIDSAQSSKISLNSASTTDLDGLPGISKSTVQKIITNRPYSSVNELITKKILTTTTFKKIKELIDL